MSRALFLLLIATVSVSKGAPFDPVNDFASTLAPILGSGERATIQKTWRGFVARGDTQAGLAKSGTEPTEVGLFLDVEVRDAEEATRLIDTTIQEGAITRRTIRIPAPKGDPQSLLIILRYGPQVRSEAVTAIEACITKMIAASKATQP